jgi:Transposase DDE domain
MKRAGGDFDFQFNAQAAVDAHAHIIVAAEVVNTSSDVQQLPMVLKAVKAHTGAQAAKVLADAGYRSEAIMAQLAIEQPDTELVIALGREGKVLAKPRDAKKYPHMVAMAKKFEAAQTQADYRQRKRLDQERAGVSPVQHARLRQGASRVQARVHGAQSAQNGAMQMA